jgi:ABC-type glycerol-3-phosphate transport system substrate-binding protein
LTKSPLLLLSAVLLAACGRPTATSSVAPSQLAPPDAFQCVMTTFKTLGFQRTMYDQDEMRTSARKENPKITFSNTQFRKTWDRLDVDVQAGAAGTDIDVLSVTEAEYFRQNGKYLEQIPPSAEVQQAAQELQTRCNGSELIPSDSVPPANQ